MEPEAHLTIDDGPHVGSVFVLPAGVTQRIGSDPRAEIRLSGIAPLHAEVRLLHVLEVKAVGGPVLREGQGLPPQVFKALRPGDALQIGPHLVRVDMHGLSGATLDDAYGVGTARFAPQSMPPGFEIERRLGAGGFGSVYAARRVSSGQRVALKVLHQQISPRVLKRFEREVNASQSFSHPNIVRMFDCNAADDPPYITMELIEGPSCEDLLMQGPLQAGHAARVGAGLASALAALAAASFVHRDIKPANVLIAPGGVAKLADFGLAKDLEGKTTGLTKTGTGVGTLAYMSPEQLRDGKRAGSPADVYSLGATVYSLLTGRPPFQITRITDARQILRTDPPPIDRPDCPPELLELVAACMRKEADARPTAAAVAPIFDRLARQLGS